MVFNSANRYRSMKYSWQNRQAPFLRPSMVEALMINSISGMGLAVGSPLALVFSSEAATGVTSMLSMMSVKMWEVVSKLNGLRRGLL